MPRKRSSKFFSGERRSCNKVSTYTYPKIVAKNGELAIVESEIAHFVATPDPSSKCTRKVTIMHIGKYDIVKSYQTHLRLKISSSQFFTEKRP